MKKSILKKNLKKVFLSLMIAMLIVPLISINVTAADGMKVVKAKTLTPLSLDGKQPKDIETVEYSKRMQPESLLNQLGEGFEEELIGEYDNRAHINSGNQGALDICWAFGNKNLVESFLSIQNNVNVEISARHMDYVLSNVMPGSINRNPGSGAAPLNTFPYLSSNKGPVKEVNFPFSENMRNPSVEDLEKNIENLYLEGFIVFPSIYKVRTEDAIFYEVEINGKKIRNITETDINKLRKNMKKHIMDYGAISAATVASSTNIEFPSEEFVYNAYIQGREIDHNVTIIGWDDRFCIDKTSLLGEIPINPGAWLVSDSNQPNGNQFYYIAYDDVFIENLLIGFNDISIGSRFNVYSHDLIGVNSIAGYLDEDVEDTPSMMFANVYEKTGRDDEFLNKVGFMTVGESQIDVYYIPVDNISNVDFERGGIKIGSIDEDRKGLFYHTIDLEEPIKLSEGKYAVYLKITSNPELEETDGYVSIPVEAPDHGPMYSNITMKNKSYVIGDEVDLSEYNFPIRAYTSSQIIEEEEDTFLVSYDLQGGTGDFPSIRVVSGNYIENSQIPTKEGYTFIGWTPDPVVTPIIKNTTFIANWELNETTDPDPDPDPDPFKKPENTATFVFGDGTIAYARIGGDGYVEVITTPSKEGYKFLGWNPDPKTTKATEDTVFYGIWEKIGFGNTDDTGNTTTDYTPGTSNDGTTAPGRIPDAGKSVTIILMMIIITAAGTVFYVKYRKIDM